MRHLVKGKKLGRSTSHRKATLQALAVALIKNKSIKTTVTKAKELRGFVEPLITKSKSDTTHNRRQVFASLQDKVSVTELFTEIAPKVGDRPGGYTRVLKLGFRLGDGAEMAVIELVDYNDVKPESKSDSKKKTRRAGRSKKTTTSPAEVKKADKVESKAEETSSEEVVEEKKTESKKAELDQVEETTEVESSDAKGEEPKAESDESSEEEIK